MKNLKFLMLLIGILTIPNVLAQYPLKLVSNNVDLTHACSVYELNLTQLTQNLQNNWLKYYYMFNYLKTLNISKVKIVHGKLNSLELYVAVNSTYTVKKPEYGTAYANITCNTTWKKIDGEYFCEVNVTNETSGFYENCSNIYSVNTTNDTCEYSYYGVVGYKNVTKWKWKWIKFLTKKGKDVTIDISVEDLYNLVTQTFKTKYIRFKVCGDYQPVLTKKGWSVSIDHIPSFMSEDYSNFTWWNSSWQYRRPITISEQSGNTLTDYQVKLTIDTASLISSGKMNSDCSDIRFTDSNDNQIPYYIESGCNSDNTIVWVKVPEIPASSTATIYMYYGNTEANSESNADNVFILYDDFSTFDSSKWTTPTDDSYRGWDNNNGYLHAYMGYYGKSPGCCMGNGIRTQNYYDLRNSIIEAYFNLHHDNNYANYDTDKAKSLSGIRIFGYDSSDSTTNSRGCGKIEEKGSTPMYQFAVANHNDNSIIYATDRSWDGSATGFKLWTVYLTQSKIYYSGQDNSYSYTETYSFQNLDHVKFYIGVSGCGPCNQRGEIYIDWVRVRKYTDPEPTYNVGSEESNQPPPTIVIISPQNKTYRNTNVYANFTVTDDYSSIFHIKAYINNQLIYDNSSYHNNTEIYIDLSSYINGHTTNNFTVWANDTDTESPGVSTKSVIFTIYTGWYSSSWKYRTPINITEQSGNTLTDYQVKLTIDTASLISEGKMNSDCSDIRFTYYDGSTEQEIPYWIETCGSAEDSIIWVKVPEIPANGQATIYMYYGNPSASSESNGTTVFDFFDDFDDNVENSYWVKPDVAQTNSHNFVEQNQRMEDQYISDGYTALMENSVSFSSNFILEAKTFLHGDGWGGFYIGQNTKGYYVECNAKRSGVRYWSGTSQTDASVYGSNTISQDVWHDVKIVRKWNGAKNTFEMNVDDATWDLGDYSNEDLTVNPVYVGFVSTHFSGKYRYWDLIRVRKYASTEPTYTIGSEETSNQPPSVSTPKIFNSTSETNFIPIGQKMTIRVNVTDPDGASDLDKVLITIIDNQSNVVVNNETMTQLTSITNGYTYEYNYTTQNNQPTGIWQIKVYANDTKNAFGYNNTTVEVKDVTPPTVIFISQTPSNIYENTTSPVSIIINITDDHSPIDFNKTAFFQGVNHTLTSSFYHYNWTWRYPANDLQPDMRRAENRNMSYWFENVVFKENPDDIWTFAGYDNTTKPFEIIDNSTTYTTINITFCSAHRLFPQIFPVDKRYLNGEDKTGQYVEISRRQWLKIRWYPSMLYNYTTQNYTIYLGINAENYNAILRPFVIYFCNSSYTTGDPENSDNCVYFNQIGIDQTRDIVMNQSEYVEVYGYIGNGYIADVKVTNTSYFVFKTDEFNPNRYYQLWYADDQINQYINFTAFNNAWYTTDSGSTWTMVDYTPDFYIVTTQAERDKLMYYVYTCDVAGNCVNSSIQYDSIDPVNHPPVPPLVIHPNETENITGLYTIEFTTSGDPDFDLFNASIYLLDENETYVDTLADNNITCNNSVSKYFYTFNTSKYPTGKYQLNVTLCDTHGACSSYKTDYNFTIYHVNTAEVNSSLNVISNISAITRYIRSFVNLPSVLVSLSRNIKMKFELYLNNSVFSGINKLINITRTNIDTLYATPSVSRTKIMTRTSDIPLLVYTNMLKNLNMVKHNFDELLVSYTISRTVNSTRKPQSQITILDEIFRNVYVSRSFSTLPIITDFVYAMVRPTIYQNITVSLNMSRTLIIMRNIKEYVDAIIDFIAELPTKIAYVLKAPPYVHFQFLSNIYNLIFILVAVLFLIAVSTYYVWKHKEEFWENPFKKYENEE